MDMSPRTPVSRELSFEGLQALEEADLATIGVAALERLLCIGEHADWDLNDALTNVDVKIIDFAHTCQLPAKADTQPLHKGGDDSEGKIKSNCNRNSEGEGGGGGAGEGEKVDQSARGVAGEGCDTSNDSNADGAVENEEDDSGLLFGFDNLIRSLRDLLVSTLKKRILEGQGADTNTNANMITEDDSESEHKMEL